MSYLVFLVVLFVIQTIAVCTTYILVAFGVFSLNNDTLVAVTNALVGFVVKVFTTPIWMQMSVVAGIAVAHQVIMLMSPAVVLNFFMGNSIEKMMIHLNMSKKLERAAVFIQDRWWMKVLMIPVVVYIYIATLVIQNVEFLTDPMYSILLLCIVCLPVLISIALWKLEPLLPLAIREKLLRTYRPKQIETPSVAVKNKVGVIAAGTMAVLGVIVTTLLKMKPAMLQFMLGPNIDYKTYLGTMGVAVLLAFVFVSIILDGQTSQEVIDTWTEPVVHDYYHRIFILMCLVVYVALMVFPFTNSAYFATRSLRMSVI